MPPVQKIGEKYRCAICGNEVTVDTVGGGALVCCNREMDPMNPEKEDQPVPSQTPDSPYEEVK